MSNYHLKYKDGRKHISWEMHARNSQKEELCHEDSPKKEKKANLIKKTGVDFRVTLDGVSFCGGSDPSFPAQSQAVTYASFHTAMVLSVSVSATSIGWYRLH